MKSLPRGKAIWNANGGFVSVLLTHLFIIMLYSVGKILAEQKEQFCCHLIFVTDYRQACAQRSHAGIVFTQLSKNWFFAPQGRHVAPINVKCGTGERTKGPHAEFHVYRSRNVGIQPQNCQNFEFWT